MTDGCLLGGSQCQTTFRKNKGRSVAAAAFLLQ
jgi:hypothetical protein